MAATERSDPWQVRTAHPCQKPAHDAPALRSKTKTLYGLKTQSPALRPWRPTRVGPAATSEPADSQQVSTAHPCQKPAHDAPALRSKTKTLYGLKTQSPGYFTLNFLPHPCHSTTRPQCLGQGLDQHLTLGQALVALCGL